MIYMFLADGFEEVEALCPLDLMRRAGLSVKTVGINKNEIVGAHGIKIIADMSDIEYSDNEAEMIFLPGGMPGTLNLANNTTVINAIKKAALDGSYIAAICAAPSILGDMGLLNGKEAICYPGFEDRLKGAVISKNKVVSDGKIITAAGMGVAYDMGIEIVRVLCGDKKANELKEATIHA